VQHLAETRIDLKAAEANLASIRQRIKRDTDVMVMIKGDAYGHGAVELGRLYQNLTIKKFGVAHVEEGIELRKAGIQGDILVLQPGFHFNLESYQKWRFEAVLNSVEDLEYLSPDKRVPLHIMVDTGMGREGMLPGDVNRVLERAGSLNLKGIATHFARADEGDLGPARRQLETFEEVLRTLPEALRQKLIVHAANSGGIINLPESHFNMVRPGISLFGLYSGHGEIKQAPVMSVHARLVLKKRLPEGSPIGYGGIFVTPREMTVGVLSVGYADGVQRALGNRSHVWFKDVAFKILGRVSMDQIVIDLSPLEELKLGSWITLWSGGRGEDSSLFSNADFLETITYERSCQIGMMRLPRVYK